MNFTMKLFFTGSKMRTAAVGILFVVFLFLRFFSSSSTALLGADNLKYLEAAKNFPNHIVYNDQLYLLHPPLYPYTIHFFTLVFQDDYFSAVLISLLSSIITFFVIYKFFMLLTNNFPVTFFALVLYTLSPAFIDFSSEPLKEPFVIMLVLLSLHFFNAGLKQGRSSLIFLSSIFVVLLSLSSDYVVFIGPSFVLSYLFLNPKKIDFKKLNFPYLGLLIVPIVALLFAYGGWSAVKFYQYTSNEYYPNGVEGTPINTKDLSLMALIDPHKFEDYGLPYISRGAISTIKKIVFQVGYMFNMEPFSIPFGINLSTAGIFLMPRHIVYMILIYLPLAIIAAFGFIVTILYSFKTRVFFGNANLYLLLVFFVFLTPLNQQIVSPRYILISYILMFYFISYGLFKLFFEGRPLTVRNAMLLALLLLLVMLPFWYANNPNFVLFREKMVASQKTADFVKANLDKDAGIMAQPGYAVKLLYLTGHRTVGLYQRPEKLQEIIDYYNIRYIVFGRFYTWDQYRYSIDTVDFIISHPENFEFIAKIEEDYSDFYVERDPHRTDEVYIYKVKK